MQGDKHTKSGIYSGWIKHKRYTPRPHFFSYQLFMVYLDLEDYSSLLKSSWFFSINRWNIASFKRSDHMGDVQKPLDICVREKVYHETGLYPNGPIRLLTHLRYWGYCFNPISFYYVFDETDSYLQVIVAEVTNTPWGERHCYVLYNKNQQFEKKSYQFSFEKCLHVSPFLEMNYTYKLYLSFPGEKITAFMENWKEKDKHFSATLSLTRQEFTKAVLKNFLLINSFMTIKVISAIYWQALKIWLKKIPYIHHPHRK
jgi:DUF1365 family protein